MRKRKTLKKIRNGTFRPYCHGWSLPEWLGVRFHCGASEGCGKQDERGEGGSGQSPEDISVRTGFGSSGRKRPDQSFPAP